MPRALISGQARDGRLQLNRQPRGRACAGSSLRYRVPLLQPWDTTNPRQPRPTNRHHALPSGPRALSDSLITSALFASCQLDFLDPDRAAINSQIPSYPAGLPPIY